jgi:hypothetical protein
MAEREVPSSGPFEQMSQLDYLRFISRYVNHTSTLKEENEEEEAEE